jgi:PHP family Zn ribbon phosphoesterase
MSPREIVARAVACGMGGMALTDHQSARNAPAIAECARRAGLACLYGLEICTAEEVHTLAIFDDPKTANEMTDWVYSAMVKRVNDPDVFGDQPIVTADDDIVEMEWRILALACRADIPAVSAKCRSLGGLYIAAHIDRSSFSVYSQLGAIPVDASGMPYFDAVELSRTADESLWLPKTAGYAVIRSSDAHNLDDVARVWTEAPVESFAVNGLRAAFVARSTRISPCITNF